MSTNMKSKQLAILLHDFELMSKTVLLQMQIAQKLIENKNIAELYDEAHANELIIDRLDIKIREEVVYTILQFNPVASDLRKIIIYQVLATNLERVGDMLLNIIRSIKDADVNSPHFAKTRKLIYKMGTIAAQMLHDSIFSFSNKDAKSAYDLIAEDDKVDRLFVEIKLSLQEEFSNKELDKEIFQTILMVHTIAHNIERIGDSATNIGEATIYLTEGKDIRHADED